MTKAPKKRLCWNCEGNVSVDAETCPFCGVSVVPASLDGSTHNFIPPYTPQNSQGNEIPRSFYAPEEESFKKQMGETVVKDEGEAEPSLDEFKKVVQAVTLLLAGSVFFLFSVALALFSTNWVFILQWDATIWFVYTILSLPLLFFGWKALMKLD